jgi:hypothetical protein
MAAAAVAAALAIHLSPFSLSLCLSPPFSCPPHQLCMHIHRTRLVDSTDYKVVLCNKTDPQSACTHCKRTLHFLSSGRGNGMHTTSHPQASKQAQHAKPPVKNQALTLAGITLIANYQPCHVKGLAAPPGSRGGRIVPGPRPTGNSPSPNRCGSGPAPPPAAAAAESNPPLPCW